MIRVIYIIFFTLCMTLIYSCESRQKMQYNLPDKIEHPKPGIVKYITPEAIVDSINHGVNLNLIFVQEAEPEDPLHIVQLPGMTTIHLSEVWDIADTMSIERPLYLICLYGDDSRKMGGELAKRGISTYYLDGGSYRLSERILQGKLKILSNSWNERRSN